MTGGPGTLRIIAGAKRGRRLKVPLGQGVRPTSEKVREAIFSALGPVEGMSVLDLFAGSGAMGLEALSRGARSCVFVEADREVAKVLGGNIAALGYEAVSRVLVSDYSTGLRQLVGETPGFDLLFVDPPYRMLPEVEVALIPLLRSLLADDGLMVVEGPKSASASPAPTPVFARTYGDTQVRMVRVRGDGR